MICLHDVDVAGAHAEVAADGLANVLTGGRRRFREQLVRVLSVLVPAIVYVLAVVFVGLYVASAIYIGAFMVFQGKYRILPAALVAVGVPVAIFLQFEIWFLVPLPKGPIETALGY